MSTATDAANLVDEWTDFTLAIAAGWGCRYPWLADDFASDAALALWRCSQSWDGRGTFKALLRVAVRRAIWDRLDKERHRNAAAFSRVAPLLDSAGDPIDPLAAIPGREPEPDTPAIVAEQVAAVPALLAGLSPSRQVAIRGVVMQDRTAQDVAEELGVSRSRVAQLVATGLAKLP